MPDLIQTTPCPRWRQSDGPSPAAPYRTACPAAHGAPWNELRITLGLPGCRTDVCLEYPLEMALVGKPEAMRHVGQLAPFARQAACPIDPPIELPGMRRQTSSRTKTTNQAITMAPGQRRQFRQGATPAPSLARYSNTARSITDNENPAASSASPLPRSSRPKNSTSAASLSPGPASAEQAGIEAAEPSILRRILPRSHRLAIEGVCLRIFAAQPPQPARIEMQHPAAPCLARQRVAGMRPLRRYGRPGCQVPRPFRLGQRP